jgi:hypothetical protein
MQERGKELQVQVVPPLERNHRQRLPLGQAHQALQAAAVGGRCRQKTINKSSEGSVAQWKNSGAALVRASVSHSSQVARLVIPTWSAVQAVGKMRVMMNLQGDGINYE